MARVHEFDGREINATRSAAGNNNTVRLLDFRHIHDRRLDAIVANANIEWSHRRPYMVMRYPTVMESVVGGRIKFVADALFRVETFLNWIAAQDAYIETCRDRTGKTRRRWDVGKHAEEDE